MSDDFTIIELDNQTIIVEQIDSLTIVEVENQTTVVEQIEEIVIIEISEQGPPGPSGGSEPLPAGAPTDVPVVQGDEIAEAIYKLQGQLDADQVDLDVLIRVCQGILLVDMSGGVDITLTAEESQIGVIVCIGCNTPGTKIFIHDSELNPNNYLIISTFSTESVTISAFAETSEFLIDPYGAKFIVYGFYQGFAYDLLGNTYYTIRAALVTETADFYLNPTAHAGKIVLVDSATPVTVTVQNSNIGFNAQYSIIQVGVGTVTIAPDSNITLESADDMVSTRKRYSRLEIVERGGGKVNISGDLGPVADIVNLQDQIDALALLVEHGVPMIGNKFITQTAGASFTAYEDYACTTLVVFNSSDVSIDIQRGGTGGFVTLPALQSHSFGGLTNSNQIAVRRTDLSASAVDIQAEAYTQ